MEAISVRGCPWRIYGSLMQNQTTFIIKSFVDEHKCCRSMKKRQATIESLANYYMECFRRNPDWKVKHMALNFQSKFFISLPRSKCYRVRTASLERLRGSMEEHYALLGPYLAELRKLLTVVGTDGNNTMFPISWVVVEGENFNSWRWFLSLLLDDLDISEGYG
ncbi:hypothetical protein Cni_G01493 [Canna indica]|uniref:Uncharacterized protein n=1 Tax=Canna indica TaxID=4628 RepID=A0AAQ3JPS7_9LILI|nr:hypothetical protein Cni_G01493 [Canna indica]